MSDDYSELIARLRELADKFSEGWHDGIRIDASDVMDLSNAAEALTAQAAQIEALRADAERLRGQQAVAINEAVAADRERMLAALDHHDWRPSNIWRYYYPSATGDWVDLRELRKLLGCPSAMQSGKAVES